MSDGFVDTNIFVHALADDRFGRECRAFLAELEQGRLQARLSLLVVHELTYVLPRVIKQFGRLETAAYLVSVLSWPGIVDESGVLPATIQRWSDVPGISFVDAYLGVRALSEQVDVYSKDRRDFLVQGVSAPATLPPESASSN